MATENRHPSCQIVRTRELDSNAMYGVYIHGRAMIGSGEVSVTGGGGGGRGGDTLIAAPAHTRCLSVRICYVLKPYNI